ncbi:helix-turn-helix domain-containing protein [Kitasatospora sp. NPDC057223]|uniref:helix-turn-helix domain-containing protein n=1 Tax=Kitasatospora sp. NPDC057223 TaxID=3346055 RepID=UPI00362CC27F
MRPSQEPLWHGYSHNDIDRLARQVVSMDPYRTDMGVATSDRYDAVVFAIVEHLATAEHRPSHKELLRAGDRGAHAHVRMECRAHGRQRTSLGGGQIAGFQRYWQSTGRTPMDERVVERLALTQIWPTLTLAQQQAVMALALTDDHAAAAAQLGMSMSSYSARLRNARLRAAALWHEGETPRRPARDKRVWNRSAVDSTGRRRLTEAEVEALRSRRAAGATLAQLAQETGYSKPGLCNLLRGKRRPAPNDLVGA